MIDPLPILDLARDLARLQTLGTSALAVDALLAEALEAFAGLVPYELATIMERVGDELRVRVACGPLDRPEVRAHVLRLSQFPSVQAVIEVGRARAFAESDHHHGGGDPFDGVLDLPHGHACMVIPLVSRGEVLGVMTVDHRTCPPFEPSAVRVADVFGGLLALALSYGEQSAMLSRLRAQLEEQNRLLREQVGAGSAAGTMIASATSPAMRRVAELTRQVARTDTPVLITGETGTGKTLLAEALHGWSTRHARPFVGLNCAALPAGLLESELFGHKKGAFSGATADRLGRFSAANGGTLFLDEVGEIPLELQAKLLRAVQDGRFEPVGSDTTVQVDVRIVAATNRDLRALVARGLFREDLYYRLAVFPILAPPLRARPEDILPVARRFLASLHERTGRGPFIVGRELEAELLARPWPGNVRELVNELERASILAGGPTLPPLGPPPPAPVSEPEDRPLTLAEAERQHIERTLRITGGRVFGERGAAALLDVNPSTLRSRMQKLGLGGARAARGRHSEL